jgi:pimeloyl-ACP methyl ester carboxylesterase
MLAMDINGYLGCCAAIRDLKVAPLVAGIKLPTLVIAGTYDESTPAAHGQRIANEIAGAAYREMPTAHFSHSEQPEQFIEVVTQFLAAPAA